MFNLKSYKNNFTFIHSSSPKIMAKKITNKRCKHSLLLLLKYLYVEYFDHPVGAASGQTCPVEIHLRVMDHVLVKTTKLFKEPVAKEPVY